MNEITETKERVALLVNLHKARHATHRRGICILLRSIISQFTRISQLASIRFATHHGSYMPSATASTLPFVMSTVHRAPLTNPVAVDPSSSFEASAPCCAVYEYVKPAPATIPRARKSVQRPENQREFGRQIRECKPELDRPSTPQKHAQNAAKNTQRVSRPHAPL